MSTDIYYFTGTGNSLFAARHLASRLDATLKPMAADAGTARIESEADAIGIVVPVYYGDLPVLVRKHLERWGDMKGKYVFAIATFGGAAGSSFQTMKGILEPKGVHLSATYGLHMPQNAFRKSWEDNDRLLDKAKGRLDRIADDARSGRTGINYPMFFMKPILILLHETFLPLYYKGLRKYSNASLGTDYDTLVHHSDKSYASMEVCNGCGICARVCPVDNIVLEEDRPVWLNRCENCLACYDWCPRSAIAGGISQKNYHYRNSRVVVADIFRQKSR